MCWEGVVCVNGIVDFSDATPKQTKLDCDAAEAILDPFGCIDTKSCNDATGACESIKKPVGTQCWVDGEDEGCSGYSCNDDMECVEDDQFDYECSDADYAEICADDCKPCTELKCSWATLEDKKVHSCDPEPLFGEPCDDENPCTVGDACGPHPDYNKLSVCEPGDGKTIDECAEELGKNEVECQLKGVTCDPVDGCGYDEAKAADWCKPPSTICYNAAEVYCTHIDPGTDYWDAETGCNVPEVFTCPELPCAENACVKEEIDGGYQYKCEPTFYPDGTPCFDGDPCTGGDLCAVGECVAAPGLPQACQDVDQTPENPCDGPQCTVTDADDPDGFECILEPLPIGTPCEVDDDLCTEGICQQGGDTVICQEAPVPVEGLIEVCGDQVDNDCDGMVDELCIVLGAMPSWLSGMLTTTDGTLQLWLGRVQLLPAGEATTPSGSYTLTITPPTAD